MKKHRWWFRVGVFVLAALVLWQWLAALDGNGRVTPENPVKQAAALLVPEPFTGDGTQKATQPADEEQPAQPAQPTEPEQQPADEEPSEVSSNPTAGVDTSDPATGDGQQSGGGAGGGQGDDGNGGSTNPTNPSQVEPPEPTLNPPDPPDPQEPTVVTDLTSRLITQSELEDDTLKFYAYISDGEPDMSLRVTMINQNTSANGTVLRSDGIHYQASLALGVNDIIISLRQNGKTLSWVRYTVTYQATRADETHPDVGEHPISVITRLDNWDQEIKTQDFTFWVTARTYNGSVISADHMQVWLDGVQATNPIGSGTVEFALFFEAPNRYETQEHTITLLVWDDEGNSAYRKFTVTVRFIDQGDENGTVTVVLDATTVGLGVLDTIDAWPIHAGETTAQVLLAVLESYDYVPTYDGTGTNGFYLRRLSRSDMCDGAKVPDDLWNMILRDGIDVNSQSFRDSLGEQDYTRGSGWMYCINGSEYRSHGMDQDYLNDGDVLCLRFTLSWGKDIGGYDASGNGMGSLSSYCGLWVNGGYTPLQHDYAQTQRQEPTETMDGYIEYTCTRCGDTYRQTLPATAPTPTEPEPTAPTEPEPTDPVNPDPTGPDPTEPEPTDPSDPEPTDPVVPNSDRKHEEFL